MKKITIEGNTIQPANADDPLENGGVEATQVTALQVDGTMIRPDRSVKA